MAHTLAGVPCPHGGGYSGPFGTEPSHGIPQSFVLGLGPGPFGHGAAQGIVPPSPAVFVGPLRDALGEFSPEQRP